jgi:hypothetical protein
VWLSTSGRTGILHVAQMATCSRRMVLVVTKHSIEYVTIVGHSMHILKKDLYGLKKTPRAWYGRIKKKLTSLGFINKNADPNLYFKVLDDGPIILLLYMDDLFLNKCGKSHLIA